MMRHSGNEDGADRHAGVSIAGVTDTLGRLWLVMTEMIVWPIKLTHVHGSGDPKISDYFLAFHAQLARTLGGGSLKGKISLDEKEKLGRRSSS